MQGFFSNCGLSRRWVENCVVWCMSSWNVSLRFFCSLCAQKEEVKVSVLCAFPELICAMCLRHAALYLTFHFYLRLGLHNQNITFNFYYVSFWGFHFLTLIVLGKFIFPFLKLILCIAIYTVTAAMLLGYTLFSLFFVTTKLVFYVFELLRNLY